MPVSGVLERTPSRIFELRISPGCFQAVRKLAEPFRRRRRAALWGGRFRLTLRALRRYCASQKHAPPRTRNPAGLKFHRSGVRHLGAAGTNAAPRQAAAGDFMAPCFARPRRSRFWPALPRSRSGWSTSAIPRVHLETPSTEDAGSPPQGALHYPRASAIVLC